MRKEKLLVVSIYKPPVHNVTYFLYWLSQIFDFYSITTREKQVIIGDFNLTPDNKSIIKTTTCFRGTRSCIDLLLTNENYSFKNTNAFETGLNDHHLLNGENFFL